MAAAKPDTMTWVRKNHNKIWSRSQFNTLTKVDYVNNNLAESFNNWMKGNKGLNLDDLMDVIRQKLMVKWNKRRRISNKLEGNILPYIVKQLKQQSFHLNMEVTNSSDAISEVVVKGGNNFRYSVNLAARTCSSREWQVSGKPCSHAIATITSFRNEKIEDYVDMCYSVEKFRATYEGVIPAILDKSQWHNFSHGLFMYPPLLKSTAGRRKTGRYKPCSEGGSTSRKRQHKCPICKNYGHH
jgi:hypothetical protein